MILTIDIINLFDKIILLSVGQCVWEGSSKDALAHFSSLGYSIPKNVNPCDYFLDITTIDRRDAESQRITTERIDMFVAAFAKLKENVPKLKPMPASNGKELKVVWPSYWMSEFVILFSRNASDILRDRLAMIGTIGQNAIIVLLIGFIFYQLPLNTEGVQSRIGVLVFLTINLSFGVVMPTINTFIAKRAIIKRERSAGTYRASSSFLAVAISSMPRPLIGCLLIAVPIYWMVGLQPAAGKYFTFLAILLVHTFCANSFGLFLSSAVPSETVGQIFGPLSLIIMLIFGGLFVNLGNITVVLKWIQYLSFVSYSVKALVGNEFDSNISFSCTPGSPCYTSGTQVVEAFSLGGISVWNCVLINFAYYYF